MGAEERLLQFADKITEIARQIAEERGRAIVFIDGRCASGKTTLGALLEERTACNLFHMDDFFLPFSQKTTERLSRPGENVDHERFLAEVLRPLAAGEPFSYRPFDCGSQALSAPVAVVPRRIAVVEGVYCCRPDLSPYGDLHVFLSVDPEEQMRRIRQRNGEAMALRFQNEWIPMEEAYFAAFSIPERCELQFCTASMTT